MSDTVTNEQLQTALKLQTDEIVGLVRDFMQQVDERFTHIKARLDEQDKKFDRLLTTIDGFISRIDKYETELAARYSQFEKLLVWARKVSEKTGIPLENL